VPIHELTEEQIRTWSLEEKDRWWLDNVYRGDMPQLTIRSALTGMILGSLLSLTNLYVGAKTGWTLGVGITSVILAFAMFKVLSKIGLGSEFTILENNAMQSIATAAGYMTSPMISSLAAYMMVTNHVIPMWQTMTWIAVLAILGVLFAFPFKRRFINDEQQPFPEGRAAGVVMDSLHHGDSQAGLLKAQLLLVFGSIAALVKFLQSGAIMTWMHLKAIPEYYDEWFYKLIGRTPEILGTPVTSLTLRPELDLPMMGAGGLMGIRTGVSILLGALVNYALLAPVMIQWGDILPNARGTIGFREITFWSLWCGVAMMTAASLLTFFSKPQMLVSSFSKLFKAPRQPAHTDSDRSSTAPSQPPDERITSQPPPDSSNVLGHIELPLSVSLVGIPLLGLFVIWMAYSFFGVAPWLSLIALVLVFAFCLIAINSTGLTSITPIGAMGKLTQLTFGVLAPGDKAVNLMTAGITGEVASHSANLLQDIKPGYMLGAKPRQQAVGHVLGVIAGALLSVPVFYLVFLKLSPEQTFSPTLEATYSIDPETYPMPAATIWKAVADVLTQGIHNIKPTAQVAALVGIALGIVLELLRMGTQGRFPLSPVGIGLGFVIPFSTCLTMFLGSFIFWLFAKGAPDPDSKVNQVVVQNQEPICAGLIAGGALMGIAVAVAELFLPPGH
jgi:OPT family oligopeptide transporter